MVRMGESVISEAAEFELLKEGRNLSYSSSSTLDHVRDDSQKEVHVGTKIEGNSKFPELTQGTLQIESIRKNNPNEAVIEQVFSDDDGKPVFVETLHIRDLAESDGESGKSFQAATIQYEGPADISRTTDWKCTNEKGKGAPLTCDGTVMDASGTLMGKIHSISREEVDNEHEISRTTSTVSDALDNYLGTVHITAERQSDGLVGSVELKVTHDENPTTESK
jgi:hypothetical protein